VSGGRKWPPDTPNETTQIHFSASFADRGQKYCRRWAAMAFYP